MCKFITEMSKQCPKTTRWRLCCKHLGTSHDVESFASGSFLECILLSKERTIILISVKETLKTLVLSAQKWSISSETALKIPTKSAIFLLFFGKVCPWKSQEIWLFTSMTYQKPCKYLYNLSIGLILATLSRVSPGRDEEEHKFISYSVNSCWKSSLIL